MDDVARSEWKRLVAVLAKRGTLVAADQSLIRGTVERWSFYCRMRAKADELVLAADATPLDIQRFANMANEAFRVYRDTLKLLRIVECMRAPIADPAKDKGTPEEGILSFIASKETGTA